MKSKTKIEKQAKNKTNSELVETIFLAKRNSSWIEIASALTGPRKLRRNVNLNELEKVSSDAVVVCGKILSDGEIKKKLRVAALGFSEKARSKLLEAGCEIKSISEEIKENKNKEGIEIIK